ncbi:MULTISPECIES: aldo/keto reductase [Streptomycetaceae]|uniref:Oxidoreductase n=1 Tax=Streptantibioticus cattleyicolor (strain ATCC 35852 / DSM 46488 / JCM 4925 / NBRC 14057 / NRRL 8057) TaxID=1003195 RepID=F8JZP0_STREN|nr:MULTISPECIES: aldo/keto reductase [Streptomycetaceae]AEW97343.1 oxidoreductase [Streptantibioticus cattleyicolor NRRL 8057 = DSM 46488]MYS61793.1 aldo/keto reductase [Streptomyces sp. SID5468]CCB77665.1 putative oxidoreductase [Streptantibioticus cattleyicolor NRRL 8057 = DSM 46488]
MSLARLATVPPTGRFGLGLAAVGRPGYINLDRDADLPADRSVPAMRERAHQLLDAAYAQGIRYVDVARSYGRAEEFLADWLADRPHAHDVVIGSKWGYTYTADWRTDAEVHEVKDHTTATYDRQLPETRALLGDRLDLYQVHSVTPDSPALTDRALHERLAALAADGVTVGVSTSGPAQAEAIRAALAVTVDGRRLFGSVQATYNLLEPSAGAALAEAHDAGVTVIVKEAMANGRLAGRDTDDPGTRLLRRIAAEAGATCDTVALAAVAARPWADVVLSGAATVPQLRSNLAAAQVRLRPAWLQQLAALAEPAEVYWRHRSGLPWR